MDSIRTPWLVLYGITAAACFMAALAMLELAAVGAVRRRPAPGPDVAGVEMWDVLDEARRITEQAAAQED